MENFHMVSTEANKLNTYFVKYIIRHNLCTVRTVEVVTALQLFFLLVFTFEFCALASVSDK